ncbi:MULTISPECIES: 3'-5' exonuclease [unclassified Shewanella]|uniref:3'-5' exonuclease n=1 Tax=unclassified Shewanella TaxID=196818 RepID=UPI000C850ACA|nr:MULTISPECIES: 3'-5' exonuclease [unclassified Shewanella]MDO6620704.1 3'-5' exonuclease [Shewanella sp. 6_MG-2023]MDO6640482.1 3'-5' exonuclease [Shewanella sp. 5_MG-2023]MDO6678866.1 3'-5' exonuclease [Shewanella sp. 4_MG-2023]MDO6777283.1 3'-5' exonuclease [Shewanella sp. 3_MG-2023]PMG28547.1 DNA polymerase III subunit epsilon [Shewanella sp. 10N.286.52.C2]
MRLFTNQEILNWKAFLQIKAKESKDSRLKKFYNASTYHEEIKLKDIEFVAVDFETTGLDANQNSIISIGLVPFTLDRIACRKAKHWFISPEDKLKEDSIIIHGITHSDLKGAPDLLRILEQLLDELAGKIVVVHYRRIERDFFDAALRSLINEGIVFPVVDTMQLEANIQQAKPRSFLDWLRNTRPASIRLANSRSRYNLPTYPPHDALTDAIATAELLQAQIQYHFSPDTPIKKLWV